MATAHLTTTQAAGESLGDWVLQLGAMVGAPAGALAGVVGLPPRDDAAGGLATQSHPMVEGLKARRRMR